MRVAVARRRARRARGRARRSPGRPRSRRGGARGRPSAVRWPNSASKTAARASRRPRGAPGRLDRAARRASAGRQAPTPSTRTVTLAELEAEQPLDRGADGRADLARSSGDERAGPAGRRARRRTWTAAVAHPDADRRAAEPGPPARPAAADPEDARAPRARPGATISRDHAADRRSAVAASRPARPPVGAPAGRRRPPSARRGRLARPSASAMRSGIRARAAAAPTPTAYPIIRRFARPWVMSTVPLTPEQRRAAEPLVVEDARGSGRCPGA